MGETLTTVTVIRKLQHCRAALGPRGMLAFLFAKATGTSPVFARIWEGLRLPVHIHGGAVAHFKRHNNL